MEIATMIVLIALVGFRLRLKRLHRAHDSRFGSATRPAVHEYKGVKGGNRTWKLHS
jgi:hypothetical protein